MFAINMDPLLHRQNEYFEILLHILPLKIRKKVSRAKLSTVIWKKHAGTFTEMTNNVFLHERTDIYKIQT